MKKKKLWPKVIETNEQLGKIKSEECFLFPVLVDNDLHYLKNSLSFVYGFTISSQNEFLIGINHYDVPKSEIDIGHLVKPGDIVFKKKYIPNSEMALDGEMLHWLYYTESISTEYNTCIQFFQSKKIPNSEIPILKWVEYIRTVRDLILPIVPQLDGHLINHYNNFLNQLITLEHAGIFFATDSGDSGKGNIRGEIKFTEYNPWTTTGRPSNRFGGINYAALNHKDGSRRNIISRFESGVLVEYDYRAFHVNLLSKILKFEFSEEPYRYFARVFFDTPDPTEDQISETKQMVFRQIYGGIRSDYKHEPFFSKLGDFIQKIHIKNISNTIKTFLFKKPLPPTDNSLKVFNHLLQNFETEINSITLSKINTFLQDKKTKCILYTYDSFLVDYSPEDDLSVITKLKGIIEEIGIKCRIKYGKNYQDMIVKNN